MSVPRSEPRCESLIEHGEKTRVERETGHYYHLFSVADFETRARLYKLAAGNNAKSADVENENKS